MSIENVLEELSTSIHQLKNSVDALAAAYSGASPRPAPVEASEDTPAPPKAATKAKGKPKASTPAPEPQEEAAITVAAVRTAIQDVVEAGKRTEALEILQEFGAAKLSDLKEEDYADAHQRLKDLLEG